MTSARRAALRVVAPVLGALLLHHALMRWLVAEGVVASILSAGEHTPKKILALAGFFVLLRLFVLLVLPGLLLVRLGSWIFDRVIRSSPGGARPG